jgi:serine/threonine protein kinase
MSCPTESAVARFVSGHASADERERITAHLADCALCCGVVGALLTRSTLSEDDTAARAATDAPSPLPPIPADSQGLGRYRIGEPIGAGGSGIVYSAYDSRLERRVALKMLWAQRPLLGREATRLHREARAMAKLAHPNVVPVFDIGVEEGRLFVAMELVEGGTLRSWLASGPHPWREVLARFRQAGEGLAAAHRVGLVHRDFKPDNVLVRENGTVLVTDFGLAREMRAGDVALASTHGPGLTSETGKVGTPVYMAPEQLRGEPVDVRADVYAFSVALWEALFGQRPFAFAPPGELLTRIAAGPTEPPRMPRTLELPASLVHALRKGMAFHRDARPESIEALLAECDPSPTPPKAPRAALIAMLVGALFAGGILIGRGTMAPTERTVTVPTIQQASMAIPTADATLASSDPSDPPSSSVLAPLAYPAVSMAPKHLSPAAPPVASIAPTAPSTSRVRGPFAAVDTVDDPPVRPPPRRGGALHGTDFEPFGATGMRAIETTHAHESDFAPCLQSACNNVTCRLQVGVSGAVSSVACSPWEGAPACTATQACLEKAIRSVHYPTPDAVGESKLFFAPR